MRARGPTIGEALEQGLTRRQALQAGGAGALALGAASCGSDDYELETSRGGDAPNVLLIITDSTRADFIGAYNRDSIARTPNLDALSREGLTFDLAVPEAMPTGPVRRCIFTGMRGFPFRDWRFIPGLPQEPGWMPILDHQPLVTEALGEAGVATAYSTDNPFLIGPQFAAARRSLDDARPDFSQGAYRFFNKPFKRVASRGAIDRYLLPALTDTAEVPRLRGHVGWNNLYRRSERDYSAARVMRRGIRLLEDLKDKEPFFLGVDAFDPHEPVDPPPVYLEDFAPKGIEAEDGIRPIAPFETPADPIDKLGINQDTVRRVRELYAAELTFTDRWIGRLLNRLNDLGLAERTVVMYLSDHGLTLGEQGILGKSRSRLQYHIHHVPFMIRHPEGRRAGDRHGFFASTHDVAQTILSFAGIRAPGAMNGEDLSVLFDGREPPERRYFTSCYANYLLAGDGRYILISDSEENEKELYDSQEDPEQVRNVADQNQEKVDELWQALIDDAGGSLPQFADEEVIGG
ncbi:MAG TPA: sulfatase [Thermoleophilaceae bacterium]|nr:sulfatase [Thermoleophilaceae bacterium]